MLCFLSKRGQENGTEGEKTTAVAKYYGFERRTNFSTEGSFGKGSTFSGHLFGSFSGTETDLVDTNESHQTLQPVCKSAKSLTCEEFDRDRPLSM